MCKFKYFVILRRKRYGQSYGCVIDGRIESFRTKTCKAKFNEGHTKVFVLVDTDDLVPVKNSAGILKFVP